MIMFKAVCFCIMAFVSPICFGGKKTYDVSSSFHEINRADVEIRTEKGNYIISKCRNTVKKSISITLKISKYDSIIHLLVSFDNCTEHTCEDLETWCKYISQYECQGNGVGKKCPKTCNKCTGDQVYLLH